MKIIIKFANYSGLLTFSFVLAVFLLTLTTNIPVYQSVDEVQTIGVKTWSGLPLPYKVSAPGLSWIEFKWWRMMASLLIWMTCIFAGLRFFAKYHLTGGIAAKP